jgi:hypothetical protein
LFRAHGSPPPLSREAIIPFGNDQRSRRSESAKNVRSLHGGRIKVALSTSRHLSIREKVLIFALIPSLLAWTVFFLVLTGNFQTAVQVVCTIIAAGFVGWHLGESYR